MRDFWIRVDGHLYDKPVVTRLCDATHIKEHEAIGVLVTFWSGVAKDAKNGKIAGYPDRQLEKWAKWRRKPGAFAAWVRAQHQDPDGRVPEWDDYQGLLEIQREKDRRRKALERIRTSNGHPKDTPRTSETTEDGDVDVDVDETLPPANHAGPNVRDFLEMAGPEKRAKWLRTFTGWLQGQGYPGGRAAHKADIEVGVGEYLLNEKQPDFGVRHVVTYVEKAEKRRKRTDNRSPEKGASGWDAVT